MCRLLLIVSILHFCCLLVDDSFYTMDGEKLVRPVQGYSCAGINCTRRELGFAVVAAVGLILLIVSATLFAVGVGRVDTAITSRHVILPHECVEPRCLEVSASLKFLHNDSVNPCDNFYAYACSSRVWNDKRLDDNDLEFSTFHELRERNEERLRSALGSASKRTVAWAAELKVKNFYQSCLNTYGNSKNGSKAFVEKMVTPAGGWQAIGTMNEATYDITNALKKVHIDFWLRSLFTVRVAADWNDPRRHIIEVMLSVHVIVLPFQRADKLGSLSYPLFYFGRLDWVV